MEPPRGLEPRTPAYEAEALPVKLWWRDLEPDEGIEPSPQPYQGRMLTVITNRARNRTTWPGNASGQARYRRRTHMSKIPHCRLSRQSSQHNTRKDLPCAAFRGHAHGCLGRGA